MSQSYYPCPHCGGDVRQDAAFCTHCGSSDSDGWKADAEDDDYQDEFDYDEFVREEFPSDGQLISSKLKTWQVIVVLLVLLSFALLLF